LHFLSLAHPLSSKGDSLASRGHCLSALREPTVLGLLVVLVVIGVTLSVLLWVGTVFLQGYLYTEPSPDTYWQAPAAGAAVILFLLVWCLINVNASHDQGPGFEPYDTLFRFNAVEDYDQRPVERIWVVRAGVKDPQPYDRHRIVQGYEYVDSTTKKPLGSLAGVQAIDMEDDTGKIGDKGEKIRFELNKDADSGNSRFVSPQGWAMGENNLGQPSIFRRRLLVANLLLNSLHFAVWFLCLWLLLRFQWGHALGLAIIIWLVMTLTVLPSLMSRTGEIAREQPATPTPETRLNGVNCCSECA
jgi:hypothetical protein